MMQNFWKFQENFYTIEVLKMYTKKLPFRIQNTAKILSNKNPNGVQDGNPQLKGSIVFHGLRHCFSILIV